MARLNKTELEFFLLIMLLVVVELAVVAVVVPLAYYAIGTVLALQRFSLAAHAIVLRERRIYGNAHSQDGRFYVQFPEQLAPIDVNGSAADAKSRTDLRARQAFCCEHQNLELARRKRRDLIFGLPP